MFFQGPECLQLTKIMNFQLETAKNAHKIYWKTYVEQGIVQNRHWSCKNRAQEFQNELRGR